MAGAGYKLFAAGDVLSASDVNTYMMQQTVMVFANSTARTTALSSVLAEGMVSYLKDTNVLEVYDGSAWVGATGDITGLTAGTGVAITSPSGPVPTVAIDTAVVPRLGVANTFTEQNIFNAAGTSTVDLIVRATASQTADLQQWQSSSSTVLSYINSTGGFVWGPTFTSFLSAVNGRAEIQPNAASIVPLTVKGAASQTANLQEWQNSAGTVQGFVNVSGVANMARFQTSGSEFASAIANGGGFMQLKKATASAVPAATDYARLFIVAGTTAGTLKLVVRAGTAGAETTILDNIPQ